MLELLALAIFAGLLVYAACTDVMSLTIHYWFGFGLLAVGFFLFQANVIGGGDAKLLAGAAVWTGFTAFAPFIFWTAMAGGVVALALLYARKWFIPTPARPEFVNRLLTPKSGVPYGV